MGLQVTDQEHHPHVSRFSSKFVQKAFMHTTYQAGTKASYFSQNRRQCIGREKRDSWCVLCASATQASVCCGCLSVAAAKYNESEAKDLSKFTVAKSVFQYLQFRYGVCVYDLGESVHCLWKPDRQYMVIRNKFCLEVCWRESQKQRNALTSHFFTNSSSVCVVGLYQSRRVLSVTV